MSIASLKAPGKPKSPIRYIPTPRESRYIQYRTKDKKKSLADIGRQIGVTRQAVSRVIWGQGSSARIESEIARILGKADWNEVVLEARSEVQKKPVDVVVREIEQNLKAEASAAEEDFKNSEQALIYGHDWSAALKAQREELAMAQAKQDRKKKGVSA